MTAWTALLYIAVLLGAGAIAVILGELFAWLDSRE